MELAELENSDRLRLSDIPLWIAFYVGCLSLAAIIWPFFALRNFGALLRSRTLFGFGVALVAVDQVSKLAMWDFLSGLGGKLVLIPEYLDLTLVTNQGAAFGLFPGQTVMFVTMALVTIVIILAYLSLIGEDERMVRAALVCIMAGAVGNLIDRVLYGYVIDFIDVHYGAHHWPVFNFADTIIDVGVGLILIDVVRDFFRPRQAAHAAA